MTDKEILKTRYLALKEKIKEKGLYGFILPYADEFQNTFHIEKQAERINWLTGFTENDGFAIITLDKSVLFVYRAFLPQAYREVNTDIFEIKDSLSHRPTTWLVENVPSHKKIGIDPKLHTLKHIEALQEALTDISSDLVMVDDNLIDDIKDVLCEEKERLLWVHPIKYAGKLSKEKRKEISERLRQRNIDHFIITNPDSTMWLLNIRGNDVPFTPVCNCYAILHKDASLDLFLPPVSITEDVRSYLRNNEVTLHELPAFLPYLQDSVHGRVLLDQERCNYKILQSLVHTYQVFDRDLCYKEKCIKNAQEIEGAHIAHQKDGVVLTHLLHWVEQVASKGNLTEWDVAEKMYELRSAQPNFISLSFMTIVGSGPNSASLHHQPTRAYHSPILMNNLLLIDSGSQYHEGTTDVTRTVIVGTPTQEHIENFTRVLKGHISLARAIFPYGTTGAQLDSMARQFLWEVGRDYTHATSHGVGSVLCVHEGPISVSRRSAHEFSPGMILSNEPGYYKEGAYGIRIENLLYTKDHNKLGFTLPMMAFENLTLAPYDLRLIDISMLSSQERQWLNAYHISVQQAIGPFLDGDVRAWLMHATRPI